MDSLKTHGWPAVIWRRASGVTRTAIRLSLTTGSWPSTDMASGYAKLVRSEHDGTAGARHQTVGFAAGEPRPNDLRRHRQPAGRTVPRRSRGDARRVRA